MLTATIRFSEYTVAERDKEHPPDTASEEYKQWHRSLVVTHLARFMWPDEMVHRIILANIPRIQNPIAFCYFYFYQDAQHTELFGVFVASPLRGHGIAFQLIEMAVKQTYKVGCRSFSLHFIEESARSSSFASRVRSYFPSAFPGAALSLKYPEEPRVERIGT